MPDMQSELLRALEEGKRKFLHNTIKDWDEHEQIIRNPQHQTTQEKAMELQTTNDTPTQQFTKSGVCSRDTFDLIRLNPHKFTTVTAANRLANIGYRKTSIHAMYTQMRRNGMIQTDDYGRLFTDLPEYTPFNNPYKKNPVNNPKSLRGRMRGAKAKKAAPAPTQAPAGLAALPMLKDEVTGVTQAPERSIIPVRLTRLQTADEVLANMSVAEAHKLYVVLGKMFGSK